MNLMDGKLLKQEILDKLKNEVSTLEEKPTLVVIQVGNNEASNVYIKQKENMCNYIGYNFKHVKLDENIEEKEVLDIIDKLNNDNSVNGILVQMPLPKQLNEKTIQNKVNYKKDVDGLNDINILNLINNKDGLYPCTALGVIELLNKYNINVEGTNVTIVGRSNLVGKPLFNLLNNKNATVTLCHSHTKDLKSKTKNADILIVAVGNPKLIKEDMVKDNAVVIDVGINRLDDKLVGDVDFDNVKDKSKLITPVPGGVGPLTIACLAKNVLKAYKTQKESN